MRFRSLSNMLLETDTGLPGRLLSILHHAAFEQVIDRQLILLRQLRNLITDFIQ